MAKRFTKKKRASKKPRPTNRLSPAARRKWPALNAQMRKTSELLPYARNVVVHTDSQVAQIVKSVQRYGWTMPVLVDESGEIVAGHGRILAAELLELEEVPAAVAEGWSEEDKRAYRILDNQLTRIPEWDLGNLQTEVADLAELDFDLGSLGFSDLFLSDLIDGDVGVDPAYTQKVISPVYEPSGPRPKVSELFDDEISSKLEEEIERANIPSDVKAFLVHAAGRHTVFKFDRIADYYAHATPEVQSLMERSALVVIDFRDAIARGFVRLNERIGDQFQADYPDA